MEGCGRLISTMKCNDSSAFVFSATLWTLFNALISIQLLHIYEPNHNKIPASFPHPPPTTALKRRKQLQQQEQKQHPHHDEQKIPRQLVVGGGFGTTATHAMFKATCQLRLRSVHYEKQCGFRKQQRFNSLAPEIPSAGILAHERLLRAHRALKDCVAAAAESSEEDVVIICPTVQDALDGMLHHIQNVLQNRQDIDALHDTPYPEFAEYILEAEERIHGTRPILLLSERDPEVWARKRAAGHPDDLICKLASSGYFKDEFLTEVHLGQNMYWCLKTAIKRNMGNASIRDIFWNVHQLDSQPEERDRILQEGYRLYRDFMRDMGAVYRVDLFSRGEVVNGHQLATEINAAVKQSTNSDLIGGSDSTSRLIVRRTPDFHTLKGCMPDHQVAFSSGRFCDKLVLFLHLHKAGGSSIIEHFIDRGLWYDLDINADIDKYGTLEEGNDLTFGGYGKNHLRIHSYSKDFASKKNNQTRVADMGFWTSIYNRGLDVVNLEYNFLSPEVFMKMESSFWKIVQFREPWERFRSTYERELSIRCKDAVGKGRCFQSYSLKRWMTKHNGVMTGPREQEWVGILYPNYYVRMLNGMGDFPRDTVVTRDHLEKAKAVLEKFDVVMILEDPDQVNLDKMIKLFGTMDEEMPALPKESNNGLKEHPLYRALRRSVIDPMRKLFREQNELDIELHEYVKIHFS